jgi:hypothetical protein
MSKFRLPLGLPISIVVLLVLGAIAGPLIRSNFSEEARVANVFLDAIPFILVFVAIILAFISIIVIAGNFLNDRIPQSRYLWIERLMIIGIVLGVVGMFQPWWFLAYRYGFNLLLISTLGFILWSHIRPRREQRQAKTKGMPVSEG